MTCWGFWFKSYDLKTAKQVINPIIRLIRLFILDHNFWTRNARKSIKGLKDSDSSLVFNENFSKMFPFRGWAPGQVTWTKLAKNLPYLWSPSQKNKTKNIFFIAVLPSLLRVWTALQHNRLASYGVAKWRKISTQCMIYKYNIQWNLPNSSPQGDYKKVAI